MRRIDEIVVHCSATPAGKPFTASDIDHWHRERGWDGIGYHYVILLDGTIQQGRPLEKAGAHVGGHNDNSVGVCYIGGMNAGNTEADNTLTPRQEESLDLVLRGLRNRFKSARIMGHRDFPGVKKACPSFDVATWCSDRGIV